MVGASRGHPEPLAEKLFSISGSQGTRYLRGSMEQAGRNFLDSVMGRRSVEQSLNVWKIARSVASSFAVGRRWGVGAGVGRAGPLSYLCLTLEDDERGMREWLESGQW